MDTRLKATATHLPAGARYVPGFVSAVEESEFITLLDVSVWSCELKRRVQHFGYRYDYKSRSVTSDAYLGSLPDWLQSLAHRLVEAGCFDSLPDQVIANEYLPGQGISAHIDCEPCFGDTIVSLSLLSSCEMVFREKESGTKLSTVLAPRSLVILKDAARYAWTHEIPARKSDLLDGCKVERSRRVSLTFRNVIRVL
ncbi:DNA repair protein [Allorhizobium taibaishanense]|uniref:DNA repair protein n=1 Tax=Allorhizobium taibaishanense TaxID=887144 RepID=A0A1Q9AB23_9HYPH|nr:DNA repair protein [Allorhizobium taibaishanense]